MNFAKDYFLFEVEKKLKCCMVSSQPTIWALYAKKEGEKEQKNISPSFY